MNAINRVVIYWAALIMRFTWSFESKFDFKLYEYHYLIWRLTKLDNKALPRTYVIFYRYVVFKSVFKLALIKIWLEKIWNR